jgi:hypothetical protein
VKCYKHPDLDAVATCATCGKAVCAECAVDVAGKIHCQECLAKPTPVTSQPGQAPPFNRMARISMICGLGGWLLWLLICCFNSTVGAVLTLATLGLAYVCLIAIGFIPLVGWIAGVVAGHMGIKEISESGGAERGREMALAGLISGYVGLAFTVCGCLAALVLTASGVSVPFIDALFQSLGG